MPKAETDVHCDLNDPTRPRRRLAMSSGDELDDTLQAIWPTVGPKFAKNDGFARTTIAPTIDPDWAASQARSLLTEQGGEGRFDLGTTLGEGGMAVVRLATQKALGREVAVKTLRPGDLTGAAAMKLLREGWLTASIEHPNVVPVYDIALGNDAVPMVVLKKIEGTVWSALMRDEAAMHERRGAGGLLDHNLEILAEVCQAVAFAHSRGIIHRDLKPENIMVGAFGEIFVLDWGLAVSLHGDETGRLPLAADAREMAGTPCYMAPEMLGTYETPALSERTDVYLLGAILYEILEGTPPHTAETALEVVAKIIESKPRVSDRAPERLVRLVQRCMARRPEDRVAGAEDVRDAIREYLRIRGAEQLTMDAEQGRRLLEEHINDGSGKDAAHRATAYHLFGACRFGFQEALKHWQDSSGAREGLESAVALMSEYELANDEPRAAQLLLGELEHPPDALRRRVEHAVGKHEAELTRLRELHRAHDPRLGRRARVAVGLTMGAVWTASPFTVYVFEDLARSNEGSLLIGTAMLIVALVVGYIARRGMTLTAFNRRIGMAVLMVLAGQPLLTLAAMIRGLPQATALLLYFVMWTVTAAAIAITLERRFVIIAMGYLAGLFFCARWPHQWPFAIAAANLLCLLTVGWIWRPPGALGKPRTEAASSRATES